MWGTACLRVPVRISCHALVSADCVPVVAPRAHGRDHRASGKPPAGSGRWWPIAARLSLS